MRDPNSEALVSALNDFCGTTLRKAYELAQRRQHVSVEFVHWLSCMLDAQDSDLLHVLRGQSIDETRVATDIADALHRLPSGASTPGQISPIVFQIIRNAWPWCSLRFRESRIRSSHVLLGALTESDTRNTLIGASGALRELDPDEILANFDAYVSNSIEAQLAQAVSGSVQPDGADTPASDSALAQFTVDWTEMARDGEMDPIVGRDEEIRQLIDVLMRRRQNNPILTGEAGVGKTAVVEGFAQRIARGDVPPSIRDVRLLALDIGLMQAGAGVKGEFEKRLRQVIDEVQSSPKPIVLFIDETHTLVGAGGSQGTGDAANLLKPALARGTLRTIGATTWSEYKKYIEKDPALTRRFQVVSVDEPSEDRAIRMLRGVANVLEAHHGVSVLDEAISGAVGLSHRYIPARQLPDKAVSVLDTAAARVAVGQFAVPAVLDDCRKYIDSLKIEQSMMEREAKLGVSNEARMRTLSERLSQESQREAELSRQWEQERELVEQIRELQKRIGDSDASAPDEAASELVGELKSLQSQLDELQGEAPLVQPQVDGQAVAAIVGEWTGIPVGRMMRDEAATVLTLADTLGERVFGQRHAHEIIVRRLQSAKAGLDNPDKPIGVFMLAGPSGVGKTETALALAEAFYGGEQNLITINMSEFQEAHTVSTLKGAPPGYVGYGEGGVLTEAVRRRPYSVVLLDEIEKAHSDVHEIFFQVFDKGAMEDGEGRKIDFRNTLIILTTNVGSELISTLCEDPELVPEPEGLLEAIRPQLLSEFPAALLGRIVQVPFYPLNPDMLAAIARLQLDRVVRRVAGAQNVDLAFSSEVVDKIVASCNEPESGGRMIDNILTNQVLPAISQEFLRRTVEDQTFSRVQITVTDNEFEFLFE